jgi:hypothetical protein
MLSTSACNDEFGFKLSQSQSAGTDSQKIAGDISGGAGALPSSGSGASSNSVDLGDYRCTDGVDANRVLICHVPPGNLAAAHTLCISKNALGGHGLDPNHPRSNSIHAQDSFGACGSVNPPPPTDSSGSGGSPEPSPSPNPSPTPSGDLKKENGACKPQTPFFLQHLNLTTDGIGL